VLRKTTAALTGLLACAAVAATPAPDQPPAPATGAADPYYPLVLAAGAVAGVVAVNLLTYGVGTLPLIAESGSAAPVIAPAAAAASRIYVITSGVLGAWLADALYTR
jgi:hypothetical protein